MPETIKALVRHEVYEYSVYSLYVLYEITRVAVKVGAPVAVRLERPA